METRPFSIGAGGGGLLALDPPCPGGHIAFMVHQPQPAACPICGQPTEERWRPFCSKRCADVDLGRWLTGRYAVPAEEAPEPDDEPGPDGR